MRPCRRLWAFWPNRAKVPPGWRAERFPLPEKPRPPRLKRARKARSAADPKLWRGRVGHGHARRLARELGVDLACVSGTGPKGRILERDVQARHELTGKIKITPLAAVVAAQAGLDITALTGTGEGGKIVREDVERVLHPEKFAAAPAAAAAKPAEGPGSVPLEGMRKIIADNMQGSLQNSAQLTLVTEADVTPCVELIADFKARFKRDKGFRLS